MLAANQRIDIALDRLGVQVDAILGQRAFLRVLFRRARVGTAFLLEIGCAADRSRLAEGRILGNAVSDEVDGVVPRHVLRLQEIGRVRLAFGEDGDQHIGPGHFGPPGRLHMDRRTLDHPLESCGGYGFRSVDLCHQRRQVVVDEIVQSLSKLFQIDGTGIHHLGGVRFIDQRQKQMLQRGEFVTTRICNGQGRMDRVFERLGKRWHALMLLQQGSEGVIGLGPSRTVTSYC